MSEIAGKSSFAFPSSFAESFKFYWRTGRSAGAQAERNLIEKGLAGSGITFVRDNTQPVTGVVAQLRRMRLSGKDDRRELNFLEISDTATRQTDHPVVVLHGYGNGLAFWWQNLKAMSVKGTRLYLHDMLGMGRSGRPSFSLPKITAKADTPAALKQRVESAENFFTDALEEFREKEKLEKMTLVGHSLGGYLATAYALRYPQRVHKLILVSPVGVPESPYEMPAVEESPADFAAQEMADTPREAAAAKAKMPAPQAWWTRAWDAGVSPFSLLRGMTVFGPQFLSRYGQRRFSTFTPEVQSDLFNYLYAISTDRGSGEYCVSHLLAPRAYARWPLITRIHRLQCPASFVYGDNDWMDSKSGFDAVKILKAKHPTSRVLINDHAGHWVHLENPAGFDRIIKRELQEALDTL